MRKPWRSATWPADAAATLNPENGATSIFILNRDLSKAREVEIVWEDNPGKQVLASWVLTGKDLKAVNSFEAAQRVQPQTPDKPSTSNGRVKFEVQPVRTQYCSGQPSEDG